MFKIVALVSVFSILSPPTSVSQKDDSVIANHDVVLLEALRDYGKDTGWRVRNETRHIHYISRAFTFEGNNFMEGANVGLARLFSELPEAMLVSCFWSENRVMTLLDEDGFQALQSRNQSRAILGGAADYPQCFRYEYGKSIPLPPLVTALPVS